MEKKRLFRILAHAQPADVAALARVFKDRHTVMIVKEPAKTLTMIKLREPVRSSLFYIGEIIVTEAVVELDGVKGTAVTMGDDFSKTLDMAVVDAAFNKGIFTDFDALDALERAQRDRTERENAAILKTMVNFTSMDQEAPQ